MNEINIIKKAVVLLCTLLMIFSSGVVLANTNTHESVNQTPTPTHRDLVWDNVMGVHGSRGGIIVATVRTEGIAFPADDFQLTTEQTVTDIAWQGGYFQCQLATGQHDYNWDWRILFWNDIGNGSWPGTEIYNQTIPDASITRSFWYNYTRTDGQTYWVANYSCQLPEPIVFNANTKYWITIQAIQTPNTYPQGAWVRHNDTDGGIKLHEAMIKAAWWGYPNWVTIYTLLGPGGDPDPRPPDLNFQLFGQAAENNPPEAPNISGPIKGNTGVTYNFTFSATDPNGDDVYYWINWSDGTHTGWIGPYPSGQNVTVSHVWSIPGFYDVKAKAKDVYDAESPWSDPFNIEINGGVVLVIEEISGGLFFIRFVIKNTGTISDQDDWNTS